MKNLFDWCQIVLEFQNQMFKFLKNKEVPYTTVNSQLSQFYKEFSDKKENQTYEFINNKYYPKEYHFQDLKKSPFESLVTPPKIEETPNQNQPPRRPSLRSQWSNKLSNTGSLVMNYWRGNNETASSQENFEKSDTEDNEDHAFEIDSGDLRSSNLFNYLVIFQSTSKWVGFLLNILDKLEAHDIESGDRLGGLCGLFLFAKESKLAFSKIRLDFFDTVLNVVFSEKEQNEMVKGKGLLNE